MRAITKLKKKHPTLDALVAKERECRELLEASLRNLADDIGDSLDFLPDDPDDYPGFADQIALHGRGIDHDATEWRKAAEALAAAKQKQAA